MIKNFESEYNKLSYEMQKEVLALFRKGDYTAASLDATFSEVNGLIQEWTVRNQEGIKYTKQIADEIGVKFVLTKQGIRNFDLIREMNLKGMSDNMALYINDIRKFGLMSQLEGKSLAAIQEGLGERFATMGRRLSTEAYTGIGNADATLKKDFYEQAGVELYEYLGPSDGKTRPECQATLDDPRQETGWTLEEIAASNTPFIERGGFNCRHDWVAWVK